MRFNRNIGNNIKLLLSGEPSNELANYLNISTYDMSRLLDGRVFINPKMVSKIATYFNVDISEIYRERADSEYSKLIHCINEFSDAKNQNLILDIMDAYVDLLEA